MTINVNQLMEVLENLFAAEGVQVTVKESLKGGLVAGVMAAVGGLLGGKTGLLVGATVGGLTAMTVTDNFRPLSDVVRDMPKQQKVQLKNKIELALKDFDINNVKDLAILLSSNEVAKKLVINTALNFAQQVM